MILCKSLFVTQLKEKHNNNAGNIKYTHNSMAYGSTFSSNNMKKFG